MQKGGFKANEYDRFGRTALMIAAEQGHTHVCEELIHLGATVLVCPPPASPRPPRPTRPARHPLGAALPPAVLG